MEGKVNIGKNPYADLHPILTIHVDLVDSCNYGKIFTPFGRLAVQVFSGSVPVDNRIDR